MTEVPAANDAFASPVTVTGIAGSVSFDTYEATLEPGEDAVLPGFRSLWYRWVAPRTAEVTFYTRSASMDSRLAVVTGTSFATLTVLDENDDDPTITDGNSVDSRVTFSAQPGDVYYLRVSAFSESDAPEDSVGVLHWGLAPLPARVRTGRVGFYRGRA